MEWKYIVEIRTIDGYWFTLGANSEGNLTKCLLLFRDDPRFDQFKVFKDPNQWNGDDEKEVGCFD